MKFLECTQCFVGSDGERSRHTTVVIPEATDPLVITKRPAAITKLQHKNRATYISDDKKKLPILLKNLTTTWTTTNEDISALKRYPKTVKKVVRVIEPPRRLVPISRRPTSRTQRLIRMYENRAVRTPTPTPPPAPPPPPPPTPPTSLEYLIQPPLEFEYHENFKNQLDDSDFERMNTVALGEPLEDTPEFCATEIVEMPISKFAKKVVIEDRLKEKTKIETSKVDLTHTADNQLLPIVDCDQLLAKEMRVDVSNCQFLGEPVMNEDGSVKQETAITLRVEPGTKIEEFYVEKTTTYLKDKKVEDKSLVLTIGKKGRDDGADNKIGMRLGKNVLGDFKRLSLQD